MSGREMLNILAERSFPADEVVALASRTSQGTEVSYGDRTLKVKALEHYDFSATDICLMSAGSAVSKEWSPKIAAAGAVVIDNSSAWRYDSDVPLIVPEVNADAVAGFRKRGIIANPNCSTAQLVVALKPLHDKAKIKRVVVATYQSVSGAGKDAMDELFSQTKAVFQLGEIEAKKFPKRIAFNLIPQIDVVHGGRLHQGRVEDGGRDQENSRSQDQAHRDLRAGAGVHQPFRSGQYRVREADHAPMKRATSCAARRAVWSSIRTSRAATSRLTRPRARTRLTSAASARTRPSRTGSSMWVVSDNLRKGAALNAIQIAEMPDQSQADHRQEEGGVVSTAVIASEAIQPAPWFAIASSRSL